MTRTLDLDALICSLNSDAIVQRLCHGSKLVQVAKSLQVPDLLHSTTKHQASESLKSYPSRTTSCKQRVKERNRSTNGLQEDCQHS